MSREEVYDRLNGLFRDIFDDDIKLKDTTTAKDVDGWDSLVNVNIIVSIEREFDIEFDMDEVGKMKNVGSMVDSICAKVKN